MRYRLLAGLVVVAMSTLTSHAIAEDWPQYRGPDGTGISPETEWKTFTSMPPVLWEAQVGTGYTSPTISAGRLYIAGWNDGKDTIYCFDAHSGENKWEYTYRHKRVNKMHEGGPSATVAIYNGLAYMVNRSGTIIALDADTGRLKWKRKLAEEYNIKTPQFGFSGSVIVHDGRLLLDIGPLLALDPDTGKTLWRSKKSYKASYATPTPFEHDGKRYVAIVPAERLAIIEDGTGREVAHLRL